MDKILISLDIETACKYGCKSCEHGLHHLKNKIDIIGIYYLHNDKEIKLTFNTTNELKAYLDSLKFKFELLGHNLKFDLKTLTAKGLDLTTHFAEDTCLMAVAYSHKIPTDWLDAYEQDRLKLNKLLGGAVHREAGEFSLKTLYPYFCNGESFWEVKDKNDKTYVLKDCEYTYKLYQILKPKLIEDNSYSFYKERLIPWSKMLYEAEIKGVTIDSVEMLKEKDNLINQIQSDKVELQKIWSAHTKDYIELENQKLIVKYNEMLSKSIEKLVNPDIAKIDKLNDKYKKLYEKAIEHLPTEINIDSPTQINWLFKKLGYDLIDAEGNETTGKAVLEKLILEGKADIKLFQQYKKSKKLITSFYDSYEEKLINNILYTNFNLSGTRTGRLSSNGPNLQQVPGNLHKIFVARPGYKLATFDMSGIEPNMIAYFSEDKNLCELLISGKDFHSFVTKSLIEYVECSFEDVKNKYPAERKLCKQIDLSLFYGSGVNRMITTAINHSINWTEKECHYKLRKFKSLFSGAFKFKEELDAILIDNYVPNVLGRPIRIEDPTDIYMKGFNTLIQSSASDLVLQAATSIMNEFKEKDIDGSVVLLVHDEIVTEIPQDRLDECQEIIIRNLTKFPLQTCHGLIKLKVEGKISKFWEK